MQVENTTNQAVNEGQELKTADLTASAPTENVSIQEKPKKESIVKRFFPFIGSEKKSKEKQNYKEVDGESISTKDAVSKFNEGLIDVKDLIAPAAIEVDFNHLAMGNKYFRTLFALGYPRFVGPNWLEPLINFEHAIDISTFYYPVDSREVMQKIKRKIAEMEATINADLEAGKIIDQNVKVALNDAKELQEQLAKGTEKFFHFALYITIHANTIKELDLISKSVEGTLGAIGVIIKPATLQQDSGFESTIPTCTDRLYVTRNMDTTSIATTFPFVSSELTMDEGIMYGINKYNRSLVIFDRFQLENYNSVIFAKSGSGKSYMVKLEVLRGLMFGIESIIIDPEKEYETLCETIGGSYISFSQDGASKLNPFELSGLYEEGEDELRGKILSLHGLIRLMVGGEINSEEDSILDRALILTYKEKGITPDPATHVNEPPLMEDLYKILKGMAEDSAHSLASKLEKYIRGSAAGIFDRKSNVEINNTFTVFSIRDLSDELRPIAMYMMLEFIWTRIKKNRKKRFLVIDEAWWMMQYPDAARFLYSVAKRARKYYLGLTTITQDIDDFLSSDYGRAIVQNSSISIFLKQSPSSVDKLQKLFYLSDGEKNYLLSVGIGEGLFFAGSNHVALEVVSSSNEHKIITSNPEELERYAQDKLVREMSEDKNRDILDEAKVTGNTGKMATGSSGNVGNNTKLEEQNLSEPFGSSTLTDGVNTDLQDSQVSEDNSEITSNDSLPSIPDNLGNIANDDLSMPMNSNNQVSGNILDNAGTDRTSSVVNPLTDNNPSAGVSNVVDDSQVSPLSSINPTLDPQNAVIGSDDNQLQNIKTDLNTNNQDQTQTANVDTSNPQASVADPRFITSSGLTDIHKVIEDALIDESGDVIDNKSKNSVDNDNVASGVNESQLDTAKPEEVSNSEDISSVGEETNLVNEVDENSLEGKIDLEIGEEGTDNSSAKVQDGDSQSEEVVDSADEKPNVEKKNDNAEVKEIEDVGNDPMKDLQLLLEAEKKVQQEVVQSDEQVQLERKAREEKKASDSALDVPDKDDLSHLKGNPFK